MSPQYRSELTTWLRMLDAKTNEDCIRIVAMGGSW